LLSFYKVLKLLILSFIRNNRMIQEVLIMVTRTKIRDGVIFKLHMATTTTTHNGCDFDYFVCYTIFC